MLRNTCLSCVLSTASRSATLSTDVPENYARFGQDEDEVEGTEKGTGAATASSSRATGGAVAGHQQTLSQVSTGAKSNASSTTLRMNSKEQLLNKSYLDSGKLETHLPGRIIYLRPTIELNGASRSSSSSIRR